MTPTITLIDTTRLKPNPNNPRKNIGDITALADSIRAHGIQQELVGHPDRRFNRLQGGHRPQEARRLPTGRTRTGTMPDHGTLAQGRRQLMVIENTQRHDTHRGSRRLPGTADLGSSIENMAEKDLPQHPLRAPPPQNRGDPTPHPSPRQGLQPTVTIRFGRARRFEGDETTQQETDAGRNQQLGLECTQSPRGTQGNRVDEQGAPLLGTAPD